MSRSEECNRRLFLGQSVAALGATGAAALSTGAAAPASASTPAAPREPVKAGVMPCGMIGKAKISRLMLGGNLVSGYMHARDLKYVRTLFRA